MPDTQLVWPQIKGSLSKSFRLSTLLLYTVGAPMAAGGSDLVTFNVGGKIYTELREPTLSLHPTFLLTQLAEDTQDEKKNFCGRPCVAVELFSCEV